MVKFVTWFSREKGSGTRGTVNITYTAHVWVILCVCVCKREREKGRGSVCVCVCARARACVSSIPKFFFEPRILCFFLGFSESNPYTGLDRLWGFQITWQSTHEGGKGISHTHRPLPPQVIFLVLISVSCWVDPRTIVRPEGWCQWKIPITPSLIEPFTFRFVALFLNQLLNVCERSPLKFV